MPTYFYECPSCGKGFDIVHAMSETPEVLCPDCGIKARRKITGGAGFIMKDGHSGDSCCGKESPCDSPKRCCEH